MVNAIVSWWLYLVAAGEQGDATGDAGVTRDTPLRFQFIEVAVDIRAGHETAFGKFAHGGRVAELPVVLAEEAEHILQDYQVESRFTGSHRCLLPSILIV